MPMPNRSDVCAPAGRTPVLVSSTTAATTKRRTFRIVILRECRTSRPARLRLLPFGVHARISALNARPPHYPVPWRRICLRGAGYDNPAPRSEEHTSELQSPYVISYAV